MEFNKEGKLKMTNENKTEESKGGVVAAAFGQLVLGAVCVAGGWIARGWMPQGEDEAAVAAREKMAAMMKMPQSVSTTNVEMRVYNLPEKFIAHAEPMQEVDLLPQVDGYVKELKFKEGDLVKAGQVLYVLDDERYQAVVGQRKADLVAAQAEKARADRYFKRMQEADARGITQLERDNAEAAALTADAAVKQAEANLVVAEYDCKKAKVIAPIDGQIGKTTAHVGDYVAPSKGALARIVQIDPMRISFPLSDRQYLAWRLAQKHDPTGRSVDRRARIILPNGEPYGLDGSFDFDDNTMNASTATIQMRMRFANPDRLLVPNTYVNLLTDSKEPPKYPCVPQTAIFDVADGLVAVWVIRDGQAHAVTVKTLEMYEGWVPVVKGLKEGDEVVTSGISKLHEGSAVTRVAPTPNDENDPNHKEFEERKMDELKAKAEAAAKEGK